MKYILIHYEGTWTLEKIKRLDIINITETDVIIISTESSKFFILHDALRGS